MSVCCFRYVTSKVLSNEYADRSIYGLPETLSEPYHAQLVPKLHKPKEFDPEEQRAVNLKKFAKLFNIHRGPTWEKDMKAPKMDEMNTIELEDGMIIGSSTTLDLLLLYFYCFNLYVRYTLF